MAHFTEGKMLLYLRVSSLMMSSPLGLRLAEHGLTIEEEKLMFLGALVCALLPFTTTLLLTLYSILGTSADNLMKALVQREAACLEKFPTFPQECQQGLFGGPGGYHPTKEAKLSVLQDFLKILPYIIPRDEKALAGVIWHNYLHMDNISVNTEDPSQITSIIDWQAVPIYPMFLIAHHPSLVEYEGPRLNGFVQPTLPENLKTLDPEAQKAAKNLFLAQSLWLTYEIEVQRAAPQLLHTFRHRETLPGQILGMIGSIYDDGTVHAKPTYGYHQRLCLERGGWGG